MLAYVVSLILDMFIVSLYFVLGVIYLMGLLHTNERGGTEGKAILKGLSAMWFVLMATGIFNMIYTMNLFLGSGTDGFIESDMTVAIAIKIVTIPILLYFLYATMKRNIAPILLR